MLFRRDLDFLQQSSQTQPQVLEKTASTLQPEKSQTISKSAATEVESAQELADIYLQLENVFLHSVGVNNELLNAQILQINANSQRFLLQMLEEMYALPSDEAKLKRRMALVDYFRYRVHWDYDLIAPLLAYIEEEVPAVASPKVTAMVFADKAELLGGIATVDADLARETAMKLNNSIMQDIASYEIYFGLRKGGKDDSEALAFVHSFNPNFAL